MDVNLVISSAVAYLVFIATQLAPREGSGATFSLLHGKGTLCDFGVQAGKVAVFLLFLQPALIAMGCPLPYAFGALLATGILLSLLNPMVATVRLLPAFLLEGLLIKRLLNSEA